MSLIPKNYSNAAVVAREAMEQCIQRLEWVTLKPEMILDIGCSVNESSALLKKRYPHAEVLSINIDLESHSLPLADNSVDLIFANFLLPWCREFKNTLSEWQRVLKPNGLLVFTLLGPDTLKELRSGLDASYFPVLMDMHDIGDLLQEKFLDPVLDVEYLTVTYRESAQLFQELKDSMMLLKEATVPLEKINQVYPVTYEIIFCHAWGAEKTQAFTADATGVVKIPLSHLRRYNGGL